mmetsp:Transcript_44370/g.141237  ORF Transcript_44370/g.141237 Transcript_44370/m.141237 type:complete len:200 (-) Transcript_44370:306-905(-)
MASSPTRRAPARWRSPPTPACARAGAGTASMWRLPPRRRVGRGRWSRSGSRRAASSTRAPRPSPGRGLSSPEGWHGCPEERSSPRPRRPGAAGGRGWRSTSATASAVGSSTSLRAPPPSRPYLSTPPRRSSLSPSRPRGGALPPLSSCGTGATITGTSSCSLVSGPGGGPRGTRRSPFGSTCTRRRGACGRWTWHGTAT